MSILQHISTTPPPVPKHILIQGIPIPIAHRYDFLKNKGFLAYCYQTNVVITDIQASKMVQCITLPGHLNHKSSKPLCVSWNSRFQFLAISFGMQVVLYAPFQFTFDQISKYQSKWFPVATLNHVDEIYSLDWSPCGTYLLCAGFSVYKWMAMYTEQTPTSVDSIPPFIHTKNVFAESYAIHNPLIPTKPAAVSWHCVFAFPFSPLISEQHSLESYKNHFISKIKFSPDGRLFMTQNVALSPPNQYSFNSKFHVFCKSGLLDEDMKESFIVEKLTTIGVSPDLLHCFEKCKILTLKNPCPVLNLQWAPQFAIDPIWNGLSFHLSADLARRHPKVPFAWPPTLKTSRILGNHVEQDCLAVGHSLFIKGPNSAKSLFPHSSASSPAHSPSRSPRSRSKSPFHKSSPIQTSVKRKPNQNAARNVQHFDDTDWSTRAVTDIAAQAWSQEFLICQSFLSTGSDGVVRFWAETSADSTFSFQVASTLDHPLVDPMATAFLDIPPKTFSKKVRNGVVWPDFSAIFDAVNVYKTTLNRQRDDDEYGRPSIDISRSNLLNPKGESFLGRRKLEKEYRSRHTSITISTPHVPRKHFKFSNYALSQPWNIFVMYLSAYEIALNTPYSTTWRTEALFDDIPLHLPHSIDSSSLGTSGTSPSSPKYSTLFDSAKSSSQRSKLPPGKKKVFYWQHSTRFNRRYLGLSPFCGTGHGHFIVDQRAALLSDFLSDSLLKSKGIFNGHRAPSGNRSLLLPHLSNRILNQDPHLLDRAEQFSDWSTLMHWSCPDSSENEVSIRVPQVPHVFHSDSLSGIPSKDSLFSTTTSKTSKATSKVTTTSQQKFSLIAIHSPCDIMLYSAERPNQIDIPYSTSSSKKAMGMFEGLHETAHKQWIDEMTQIHLSHPWAAGAHPTRWLLFVVQRFRQDLLQKESLARINSNESNVSSSKLVQLSKSIFEPDQDMFSPIWRPRTDFWVVTVSGGSPLPPDFDSSNIINASDTDTQSTKSPQINYHAAGGHILFYKISNLIPISGFLFAHYPTTVNARITTQVDLWSSVVHGLRAVVVKVDGKPSPTHIYPSSTNIENWKWDWIHVVSSNQSKNIQIIGMTDCSQSLQMAWLNNEKNILGLEKTGIANSVNISNKFHQMNIHRVFLPVFREIESVKFWDQRTILTTSQQGVFFWSTATSKQNGCQGLGIAPRAEIFFSTNGSKVELIGPISRSKFYLTIDNDPTQNKKKLACFSRSSTDISFQICTNINHDINIVCTTHKSSQMYIGAGNTVYIYDVSSESIEFIQKVDFDENITDIKDLSNGMLVQCISKLFFLKFDGIMAFTDEFNGSSAIDLLRLSVFQNTKQYLDRLWLWTCRIRAGPRATRQQIFDVFAGNTMMKSNFSNKKTRADFHPFPISSSTPFPLPNPFHFLSDLANPQDSYIMWPMLDIDTKPWKLKSISTFSSMTACVFANHACPIGFESQEPIMTDLPDLVLILDLKNYQITRVFTVVPNAQVVLYGKYLAAIDSTSCSVVDIFKNDFEKSFV